MGANARLRSVRDLAMHGKWAAPTSTACTAPSTIPRPSFTPFDMLVSDGDDLRKLPLSMRKTNLSRLLTRRVDGIHLAPFEQGEIGLDCFGMPV